MSIDSGMSLAIEKGTISRIEIKAPWHRLYEGYMSINMNDLNVLMQVKASGATMPKHSEGNGCNISQDLKMVNLI
jgi:hypothetical protein